MPTVKKTVKKLVKKDSRLRREGKEKPKKPLKTAGKKELKLKDKVSVKKGLSGRKEKKEKTPLSGREKKEVKKKAVKSDRYFEAIGRRKTAIARVRIFTQGEKVVLVNEKPYQDYFPILENQQTVVSSLEKMKALGRFRVSVKVRGGGISAQAEAIRHGISRALLEFNPDFRKKLRRAGFLTRDPRMRERKKFGLKRARRAPQWRKR
jgi:small subunit ribosomal protein S9